MTRVPSPGVPTGRLVRATHFDRSPGGKDQCFHDPEPARLRVGDDGVFAASRESTSGMFFAVIESPRISPRSGETRANAISRRDRSQRYGHAELRSHIPEDPLGRLVTNFDRMLHLPLVSKGAPCRRSARITTGNRQNAKAKGIPLSSTRRVPAHGGARSRADRAKILSPILGRVGLSPDFIDNLIEIESKVHDQGVRTRSPRTNYATCSHTGHLQAA